jgi:hypothetical protein
MTAVVYKKQEFYSESCYERILVEGSHNPPVKPSRPADHRFAQRQYV